MLTGRIIDFTRIASSIYILTTPHRIGLMGQSMMLILTLSLLLLQRLLMAPL